MGGLLRPHRAGGSPRLRTSNVLPHKGEARFEPATLMTLMPTCKAFRAAQDCLTRIRPFHGQLHLDISRVVSSESMIRAPAFDLPARYKNRRQKTMKPDNRPISPFVTVYRWRYTFLNPSIIHRATGLLLTVGGLLLLYFLFAVADGPEAYGRATRFFSHPLAKLFYVAVAWSFSFHLLHGIRHLIWDTGHGFNYRLVRWSGLLVYAGTTMVAAACAYGVVYR
jgi:succinate dehydrogenase / fumarate reductase cytochrome b subunit